MLSSRFPGLASSNHAHRHAGLHTGEFPAEARTSVLQRTLRREQARQALQLSRPVPQHGIRPTDGHRTCAPRPASSSTLTAEVRSRAEPSRSAPCGRTCTPWLRRSPDCARTSSNGSQAARRIRTSCSESCRSIGHLRSRQSGSGPMNLGATGTRRSRLTTWPFRR